MDLREDESKAEAELPPLEYVPPLQQLPELDALPPLEGLYPLPLALDPTPSPAAWLEPAGNHLQQLLCRLPAGLVFSSEPVTIVLPLLPSLPNPNLLSSECPLLVTISLSTLPIVSTPLNLIPQSSPPPV